MQPNVLITSAGRRGKLVSAFRRELAALLPGAQVFAADMCPELSAGCQLADESFVVPHVRDADYIRRMRQLCAAQRVGLVVPTIDTELTVLARERDEFAAIGVRISVPDADFVAICRDKRKTSAWFVARGLAVPRPVDLHSAPKYPLFAKPYDGSSGQEARVVNSPAELHPTLTGNPKMMFLEYLSPAEHVEYTVDMYYSLGGKLKCMVPRLRIETRAGEVSKSRTARFDAMVTLRECLGHIDGGRGCITLQVFIHRDSGRLYAIEINPRFGGGYPLSYEAGANFPRWLIQENLLCRPVEFFDAWESDLTMLRYDEHVLVRNSAA